MATLHDRTAVRAYFAWIDAGRPEGRHEACWIAAEAAELLENDAPADPLVEATPAAMNEPEGLPAKRNDLAPTRRPAGRSGAKKAPAVPSIIDAEVVASKPRRSPRQPITH